MSKYPDVRESGTDPLAHYLETGWKEGKDPRADFSVGYYLSRYPDLAEAEVEPLTHYVLFGRFEGRSPTAKAAEDLAAHLATANAIRAEFDSEFYLQNYPETGNSLLPPVLHYVQKGWREGKDPNPDFSTRYYLAANPDIASRGVNPFFHYIRFGRHEGRHPKQLAFPIPDDVSESELYIDRALIASEFDTEFYLRCNPTLQAKGVDPIIHYLLVGWRSLLDPSPEFSTSYYLEENPDIAYSQINPFVHYVAFGRSEGRLPRPGAEPATYSSEPAQLATSALNLSSLDALKSVIEPYFDNDFYLRGEPDMGSESDPVIHYLTIGWRELRDPSPHFSTSYYLESYPDLRSGGINPFVHYVLYGRREKRSALPYGRRLQSLDYKPLVSVIVPNYNHAPYLKARLDSILDQTYENIEVLILDDCSTDESASIIREYESLWPKKIRTLWNTQNSGCVFRQWRKGIEDSTGDLLWICESDDYCEKDFLEKLVGQFVDPSVLIGFGRIQFCDADGNLQEGLDAYREAAEPGIWNQTTVRPAKEWFCGAFGVSNVIANVGGCLIRRQPIDEDVWREAESFRVVGDWYLYVLLANGGRIAYAPGAVAYFRQHGANTSVKAFHRPEFYVEKERVLRLLRARWGIPQETAQLFYERTEETFVWSQAEKHVGKLQNLFNLESCLNTPRTKRHILIAFLGFHVGGGEFVAIHLANALLAEGFTVSALCLDPTDPNESMRKLLDPRIAVYDSGFVRETGTREFLQSAGVDLIHSHVIGVEYFFFANSQEEIDTPYLVTLHGSYEIGDISADILLKFLRGVSHWVYLAEKNLLHLKGLPISPSVISHIGNGMPIDEAPFPQTREQLGIGKDDFVFTVVSRPLPEKGWEQAVKAFLRLQERTSTKLHLLFCGAGEHADSLKEQYGAEKNVRFLGFQSRIHGIYRLSDCALLPSRFGGESFPLTLIQAMQVGTPFVATRVGQIESMSIDGDRRAGLLIDIDPDDEEFIAALSDAMEKMLNREYRLARAQDALHISGRYSMKATAAQYAALINRIINERQKIPPGRSIGAS